jgi:hypothetical protein
MKLLQDAEWSHWSDREIATKVLLVVVRLSLI